jgi:hypothetical protein
VRGWKSQKVHPYHVIPRKEWWNVYQFADGGLGDYIGQFGGYSTENIIGEFLFADEKTYILENGIPRELSLWK